MASTEGGPRRIQKHQRHRGRATRGGSKTFDNGSAMGVQRRSRTFIVEHAGRPRVDVMSTLLNSTLGIPPDGQAVGAPDDVDDADP